MKKNPKINTSTLSLTEQADLNSDLLRRTSNLSSETSDLRTNVRDISDDLSGIKEVLDALEEIQREQKQQINESVAAMATFRIQSDSRAKSLLEQIDQVRFKNDKREESQVLRDQSNVQSLTNLQDMTEKAFSIVEKDVNELDKADKFLAERVSDLENAPVATDGLPEGHEWVNKKFSGVYETTDSIEARLDRLEARLLPKSVAPGTTWDWKRVDEMEKRLQKLEQPLIDIYCRFYGSL